MSGFCCINLKENKICKNFNKFNQLAKDLIKYSIEKDIAVFFNSFDYGNEIIKSADMQNFILVSDSFIYKNCGFLNTNFLENVLDYNESEKQFVENFDFLNLINETIFKYKINEIEIFITADGSVNCIEDFEKIECKCNEYLKVLFKNIIIKANEYAYGFPTLKVSVKL